MTGSPITKAPETPHPDDVAVDRFAVAMKAKLAKKRGEGRRGWDCPKKCSVERLAALLVEHVVKGDPLDVGNFAMMLWNRGCEVELLRAAKAMFSPELQSSYDSLARELELLKEHLKGKPGRWNVERELREKAEADNERLREALERRRTCTCTCYQCSLVAGAALKVKPSNEVGT